MTAPAETIRPIGDVYICRDCGDTSILYSNPKETLSNQPYCTRCGTILVRVADLPQSPSMPGQAPSMIEVT